MRERKNKNANRSGRETLKSQKKHIIIAMGNYFECKEANGGIIPDVK
jgi:hypothetical protein